MDFTNRLFNIPDECTFNKAALDIFRFQYEQNRIYRQYVDAVGTNPSAVVNFSQVPFLPILFFKTASVICGNRPVVKTFMSSGTTGTERSQHPVIDLDVYRKSLHLGFEKFYGYLADYDIFGLMPSPAENPDSSLIFMVNEWITKSGSELSGFYLNNYQRLAEILQNKKSSKRKSLVIGLSYALMDFSEYFQASYAELIIMETGGMKGKRKEMIREELHDHLAKKFGIPVIHSEYGMTELLSQAYSQGKGKFHAPGWMKVLTRDPNDPFLIFPHEKTGCLNIIDLANFSSCSFIATEDIGKTYQDGSFEMLGRFDSSAVRGCNLMIA